MFGVLDSGVSTQCSSLGPGQSGLFMGKTLHSHGASLHPGVLYGSAMIPGTQNWATNNKLMILDWKWSSYWTTNDPDHK